MVPNISQSHYIGNIISDFEVPDMILTLLSADIGANITVMAKRPILMAILMIFDTFKTCSEL